MGQRFSASDSSRREPARGCGSDATPVNFVRSSSKKIRTSLRRFRSTKRNARLQEHRSYADIKCDKLDINVASAQQIVHQLPWLPLELAERIVHHRGRLGPFRSAQQLQQVRGVDEQLAVRLEQLVSFSPAANGGYCGPDMETTTTSTITANSGSASTIDLNTATESDLLQLTCLSLKTAQAIIHYRDKYGPFKSTYELLKVRGVSRKTVRQLAGVLIVDCRSVVATGSDYKLNTSYLSLRTRNGRLGERPAFRRTHSAHPELVHDRSTTFFDVCELLALNAPRPMSNKLSTEGAGFKGELVVATWNLERLSADKARNPGVMEVICRTLLENRISLLAVQDVLDEQALKMICDQLNNPTLLRVKNWPGWRGQWQYVSPDTCDLAGAKDSPATSSATSPPHNSPTAQAVDSDCVSTPHQCCLGFVFDSSKNIRLLWKSGISTCEHRQSSKLLAFTANFQVKHTGLAITCVHLERPTRDCGVHETCWCVCRPSVSQSSDLPDSDNRIVLGQFESLPDSDELHSVWRDHLKPVLGRGEDTNSSLDANCKHYSNIWLPTTCDFTYSGECQVVRCGLSHLAIPCGWQWGGQVSSHAPLWCRLRPRHSTLRTDPVQSALLPDRFATLRAEYHRRERMLKKDLKKMALDSDLMRSQICR